jgi:hypothetical protein
VPSCSLPWIHRKLVSPAASSKAASGQLLLRESANGPQQLVAAAFPQLHEQRFLHQPGGESRRLGLALLWLGADGVDGRQGEPAGKHDQALDEPM